MVRGVSDFPKGDREISKCQAARPDPGPDPGPKRS